MSEAKEVFHKQIDDVHVVVTEATYGQKTYTNFMLYTLYERDGEEKRGFRLKAENLSAAKQLLDAAGMFLVGEGPTAAAPQFDDSEIPF